MSTKRILKRNSKSTLTTTGPRHFVFVLMPFAKEFNDVYQYGIVGACKAAGAYCERVDEQIFQESILEHVYNQIAKADTVVADMTGKNANVFYEVGYAHALNKRVILVTSKAEDIPFDLKHFQHIIYDGSIKQLHSELIKRIRWSIANPDTKRMPAVSGLEVYMERIRLRIDEPMHISCKVQPGSRNTVIGCEIRNLSTQTIEAGSYEVAIVLPALLEAAIPDADIEAITYLPEGPIMITFTDLGLIFPDSWSGAPIQLTSKQLLPHVGNRHQGEVRVYTSVSKQVFPFTFNFVK